jgi:predicted nuclease of predicted toxin-antitoxin system
MQLRNLGHDAAHTLDLPGGNRTTDGAICAVADENDAVVITKDADFVITRMLKGSPRRLLVIATGNIRNDELMMLIERNFARIESLFETPAHVELSRTALIVRE